MADGVLDAGAAFGVEGDAGLRPGSIDPLPVVSRLCQGARMRISKRVMGVVGAGLLAQSMASGCSRAEGEKAGEGVWAPDAIAATIHGLGVARSELAGLTLAAMSDLPRSPENGAVEEYCQGYRERDLTATGQAVAALGWVVTSEAQLGRYRVVSFASGFDPGTSAICTVRNGNIGVFDGGRLVALVYAPDGEDAAPGPVEAIESGALLVWGGDYPAPPLGELHLEGAQLRLTGLAAERTFCHRTAIVPNVYGQPIEVARTALISQGWRPLRPEETPGEYDRASDLAKGGVIEAEACSGTGMGYCAFKYQGPRGVLDVTTAGEDETVVGYNVDCSGG